jgi:hypothetical protein
MQEGDAGTKSLYIPPIRPLSGNISSIVVGFRGPLKNHMISRMIFRSGRIDIFGQLGS